MDNFISGGEGMYLCLYVQCDKVPKQIVSVTIHALPSFKETSLVCLSALEWLSFCEHLITPLCSGSYLCILKMVLFYDL